MTLSDDNILEGSLVRLTALSTDDAPQLARFSEHAGVNRMLNTQAQPASVKETVEWIEGEAKNPNSYLFAIRRLADDELLGFAELDGIDWTNQTTGLGIGLGDPTTWDHGYGRDAMELLMRFSFHELNLHRIGLTVFEYNERAVALYEKLGFVREGSARERLIRDGERFDMYMYGLLRSEWVRAGG